MRRAGKRTVGTLAIGLMVAMVVASVFGVALLSAHAGVSASGTSNRGVAPAGMALSHPAASHPDATTFANITGTNAPAAYQYAPFTWNLTLIVTGSSVNLSTTHVWVGLIDAVEGTYCGTASANTSVTNGKLTYNVLIGSQSLTPALLKCPGLSIHGTTLIGEVLVDNSAYGGTVASNTTSSSNSPTTDFIFAPLSAALLAPSGSVGAGNVSLIAEYVAQYVVSVQMTVWNAAKTTVLYNASLEWASPTAPTVGTWYIGTAGTYPYNLYVLTSYGGLNVTGSLSVLVPGGGTIFKNTSTWQNASIFSGVSGAVSGTILLVVGLILGMIVALAVGRSLMRPASAAPAQPWQPSGTGANQCSVCGKSFATPEELKDHAKAEHGMS